MSQALCTVACSCTEFVWCVSARSQCRPADHSPHTTRNRDLGRITQEGKQKDSQCHNQKGKPLPQSKQTNKCSHSSGNAGMQGREGKEEPGWGLNVPASQHNCQQGTVQLTEQISVGTMSSDRMSLKIFFSSSLLLFFFSPSLLLSSSVR